MSWTASYSDSTSDWPQMSMDHRTEVVIVVDPYDSSRFLLEELLIRGWPLVAMRSSNEASECFDPSLFERVLVHTGDLLGTARSLRELVKRPVAVVAGSETGVALADALAEVLSLRGNGRALTQVRQDKYFTVERLRECGLTDIVQGRFGSAAEVAAFTSELTSSVIVKPCRTQGGSECLSICGSSEAAAAAAAEVLGSFDRRNDAVIVQEHIEGTEYIVDCVTCEGQSVVTGLWVCRRTLVGRSFAYDRKTTVPFLNDEGSVHRVICQYVFQCLAALGVQSGASHTKVVYHERKGPYLLKMCPWMHGSLAPAVYSACIGRENAQANLLADALTDGGMMMWKLESMSMGTTPYELGQYAIILDLQCHEDGILAQSVEEASGHWLRALSSFWSLKCDLEPGDRISPSRDAASSPGHIILIGADPTVVEAEAAMIREAERNGQLYVLSTSTSSKTPTPPTYSDDEGTWGKGCFLPISNAHPWSLYGRDLEAKVKKLETSPPGSPDFLPKACAEFVLAGVLE